MNKTKSESQVYCENIIGDILDDTLTTTVARERANDLLKSGKLDKRDYDEVLRCCLDIESYKKDCCEPDTCKNDRDCHNRQRFVNQI